MVHRTEKHRLEAERRLEQLGGVVPEGLTCGAPRRKANGWKDGEEGGTCDWKAGSGTAHLGVGLCRQHGGNGRRERAVGAWMMAHEMARALNVTPWEALLGEVRRTAGSVAFLDQKVAQAPDDEALLDTSPPDRESGREGGYGRWVKMRQEERTHLARVSKMALDAGVAERLVAQYQFESRIMADAFVRALGELAVRVGLSEEDMEFARAALGRQLLAIEATMTNDRAIDGEVVDMDDRRKK